MGYKREKWNSIVNKTPLLPESNRQIGGEAPSVYSRRIMRKAEIGEGELRSRVESHLVDYDSFIPAAFERYGLFTVYLVPEATIDKNNGAVSRKNNVRFPRELGYFFSIPKSLRK